MTRSSYLTVVLWNVIRQESVGSGHCLYAVSLIITSPLRAIMNETTASCHFKFGYLKQMQPKYHHLAIYFIVLQA
ncbi:MAG: hypothetical protein WCL14_01515 [Bacteroidota bacterium]